MKYFYKCKIIYIFFLIFNYQYRNIEKFAKPFNNNEKNIIGINYLRNLRKVIYTSLLGNYDIVSPIIKENGYDYFLLTDQSFENQSDLNWTIINIKEEIKYLNMNIIKRQRFFKTHPHLFFSNYDLSIYIDTSLKIEGKMDTFLLRVLSSKKSIYVLEHPQRNKIYNEFKVVVDANKETKNNVISIKNKYNKEKFPDNTGLAECCLIIRKHNEYSSINFMEDWFKEIKDNSHRDQLSFNYILWKTKNKYVKYISKKLFFQYFSGKKHLYNYKLLNNSNLNVNN